MPADNPFWTPCSVRQEEAGRQVLPAGASVCSGAGQAFSYEAQLTASCDAAGRPGGQQQLVCRLHSKVRPEQSHDSRVDRQHCRPGDPNLSLQHKPSAMQGASGTNQAQHHGAGSCISCITLSAAAAVATADAHHRCSCWSDQCTCQRGAAAAARTDTANNSNAA